MVIVKKGTRVAFRFMHAHSPGTHSLAGAQMKTTATEIVGEGTVRNVWADDPMGTTNLRFNVQRDDGSYVVVPQNGVRAAIEDA